jgi:hypothetical protein
MNGQYFGADFNRSYEAKGADMVTNDNDTPMTEPDLPQVQSVELKGVETQLMGKTKPYRTPMGETSSHEEASKGVQALTPAALVSQEQSVYFRARWNEVQGHFVDEPRAAVQQASELVAEVFEQITQMFANEHNSLDGRWNQNQEISTEDLRKALQRYHDFFNRLVV